MQLGIHFVNFTLPGAPASIASTLAETARIAEEGGASDVHRHGPLVPDGDDGPGRPTRCSRATPRSGSSPARPERMRLGLLVTGVTYRHPGLLAKIVTTLDVLSGGRAQLGIGAAWYEREHRGLGVPFPPLAERFERLEETLQICLQMWSDDDGPYEGTHYQLAETICSPPPISSPRPRDPHRWRRRAEDPAARRPLRRRLQPVRHVARRGRPQARRARPALRGRGPRPGHHRPHHPRHEQPARRPRRLRRPPWPTTPSSASPPSRSCRWVTLSPSRPRSWNASSQLSPILAHSRSAR